MKELTYTIAALLTVIVSTGLLYLYFTSRQKEAKGWKAFFTFTADKKTLILSTAILLLAAGTYLYSFYVTDSAFLKALMNAETALWLLALGYIDFREKIIPNPLILAGIVFWVILSLLDVFIAHTSWKQLLFFSLVGAGICGGVLFIIALIVKSALGMGDVKMFFVIGLLYGLTNTYSILLFSIVALAIFSIVMLIAQKVTRKTSIPMAPFVGFGFLISVLIGM